MKQIIIVSLFLLLISLSSQQNAGFRYQKNNRFKYMDSRRIRNNPRLIKMHRTNLPFNKENDLKNTIINDKGKEFKRGSDGQYLNYGRSRFNLHKI